MKLKCKINGKEYPIVQGCTFAEEYNETLDSGVIIISGVPQIVDLKPYDDVFIYSGTFNGYPINNVETPFYRHLLVDQFSETLQNINERIYEYKIELMSETKKLEVIQLPNTSITQPIVIDKKRSVWSYLEQYVEMYSPLYKHAVGEQYAHKEENFKPFRNAYNIGYDYDDMNVSGSTEPNNDCTFENGINLNCMYDGQIANGNLISKIKLVVGVDTTIRWKTDLVSLVYNGDSVNYIKVEYKDGTFTESELLDTSTSITKVMKLDNGKQLSGLEIIMDEPTTPSTITFSVPKTDTWFYDKKYTLDTNLQPIFDDVYCPDFTLNAPSLKDVLTQLMLVKDMLPYVKDDIIYGLDITERKGQFDFDQHSISNVIASMSSDNYANNLRRNYSNALSQEKSARRVEYLGFRNSDESLLTIENMRLETSFPIYKINKVYMCYYKKGEILQSDGTSYTPKKYLTFLCKQDITKLVLLNSTRNLLSLDWNDFEDSTPRSIDELAKYKLCTVGYDIGSKFITGWGTKYEYPTGWWGAVKDKTYIQNIATILDKEKPYGIYTYGYVTKGKVASNEIFDLKTFEENIVVPNNSNIALAMKTFTFMVDYDAFYNGAVVHSKDNDMRDDITINDNTSSSLTLLEKDGLFQKEKLNRFGNKAIQINATYDTIDQMQELGSVYNDDVIIYHREYSIYDNFVNTAYFGTKDYVLKNYFVSVYAKHRTYNLMSYGESVNRAENRKMYLMLSKDKSYYENENRQIGFSAFSQDALKLLFSSIIPSDKAITINNFDNPNVINAGYIKKDGKLYLTDANAFVSGYSLCFNIKMYDNVSTGVYIKDFAPQRVSESVKKDFTGSVQDWDLIADRETGAIDKLGMYVGHLSLKNYFYDKVIDDDSQIKDNAYPRVFVLPHIKDITSSSWQEPTNVIGNEFTINKDNKETIDMTMQFEPITNDENLLFSQWFMKLSELVGTYTKIDEDYTIKDDFANDIQATIKYVSADNLVSINKQYVPTMIMEMDIDEYNKLDKTKTDVDVSDLRAAFNERTIALPNFDNAFNSYQVKFNRIVRYETDAIVFYIQQTIAYNGLTYINYKPFRLHRIYEFGKDNRCPKDKIWFSNAHVIGDNKSVVALYDPIEVQWSTEGSPIIQIPRDAYNCQTPKVFNIGGSVDDFESRVTLVNFYIQGQIATKVYKKNMFVVTSTNPLKKTLVYDEYRKGNLPNIQENLKLTDTIIYRIDEQNKPSLRIPLLFNISWLNNAHRTITITDTSQLTNVGVFTNWINTNAVKQDSSSGLLGTWIFNDDITGEEVNFNLSFTSNGEKLNSLMVAQWFGGVYILYNSDEVAELNKASSPTKSIQYWYYDEDSASYKFVFGVNISDKDKQLGYIDIYLSLVSTRDERVYDDKHNVVGYVNNYASKDNVKLYGEEQYYK